MSDIEVDEVVVERYAVTFSSKGKPHYIGVNEDTSICGKEIPPVPDFEWSLTPDRKTGLRWPTHKDCCKTCQKILNQAVSKGVMIRLAKPNEGRGEGDSDDYEIEKPETDWDAPLWPETDEDGNGPESDSPPAWFL